MNLARRVAGGPLAGATALVAVPAAVADLRHPFRRHLIESRGDELRGRKDLEVALGAPVALGAVEDAAGFGVVRDFFEGERGTEEILGEAAAAGGIVGGEPLAAQPPARAVAMGRVP